MEIPQEVLSKALAQALSEGAEDALAPVVSKLFDAKLKEHNVSAKELQLGVVKGITDTEDPNAAGFHEAKKERVCKFIKAVVGNDVKSLMEMQVKALNTQTDSDGGFLVPEELQAEIVRLGEDYGYIRKFARKFTLTSPKAIPVEGAGVSLSWPGEGNAGSESNPTFKQPRLDPKTLVGLSTQTNELLADANVSVVDYLIEIFAEAFAGEEDFQGFQGVGTPFVGVLAHDEVNEVVMSSGNTSFNNVDLDDLKDMRAQCKSVVLGTSGYFMHRTVWNIIQKLKENSQSIMTFPNPSLIAVAGAQVANLKPQGSIDGYPVYLSDQMPSTADDAVDTSFIIFGSLSKGFFFGDRQQIAMEMSGSATVNNQSMFTQNKKAVRFTERIAQVVGLPNALVKLTTAAS